MSWQRFQTIALHVFAMVQLKLMSDYCTLYDDASLRSWMVIDAMNTLFSQDFPSHLKEGEALENCDDNC
jgi:hypothetical protein